MSQVIIYALAAILFMIWLLVGSNVMKYFLTNLKPIITTFLIVAMLVLSAVYAASSEIKASNRQSTNEEINIMAQANGQSRYERGLEQLREIDGEAGEKVIESLQDIAPDLARYTIEYPFGDIYSRPGLDLKSREIATIAALTAMGNAQPQLKVHIQAGLNVGLTQEEIVEVIMQMSVYSGIPTALNGIQVAKEVFQS